MKLEVSPLSGSKWRVDFAVRPDELLAVADVESVSLSGTFINWDKIGVPMELAGDGLWKCQIDLEEGEHLYKFIINGQHWFADPNNALSVDDPHHGKNSVLGLGRLAGRRQAFVIEKDVHWRAITSPRRLELLEFLLAEAPCSIAELADAMDVAADGLYHHMRILLKANLVREVGSVLVANRNVPVFDVAARELHFVPDDDDRLPALWRSLSRSAERLIDERGVDVNEEELFSLGGETGWINEERTQKIRTHLAHIKRLLAEGRQDRDGQLVSFTHLLLPVERKRRNS